MAAHILVVDDKPANMELMGYLLQAGGHHLLFAHNGLKVIPCIAVTALAVVGNREKLLEAGFDGYINKPIDPETFVATIEGFFPNESPGAGSHEDSGSREQGT